MSEETGTTGAGRDEEVELEAGVASALRELPLEIAPERELFSAVKKRIRARRESQRRRLLALAAGLALALGAAFFFRAAPPESAGRRTATAVAAGLPVESAVRRTAFSESDRALEEIRTRLRMEIEAKQERLPPETRKLVFENLATIDRAIAEIERALAAEPANAELGRTYIAYREREIDLLRQANRTAARL